MAHYHDYQRAGQDRINYSELEHSRVGSRAILIALGIIALAIVAMFMFGDIQTSNTPMGAIEQAPAPTPLAVPAE